MQISALTLARPASHPADRSAQPSATAAFRLADAGEERRLRPRTLADAEALLSERERRHIDAQAEALEGVFLRMIMRRIQGSLGKGAFGESAQSQFLKGFAFDELGNAMAGGKEQGLGLGRMIYEVLIRDEAAKVSAPITLL